jgi:hypothetical protein
MSRLGLSLRDVEGDGNCLFRALSDQLYGEQNRHPEIRKLTCDYLETHKQDMEFWVLYSSCLEGEDYAAYVTRMRKSGESMRGRGRRILRPRLSRYLQGSTPVR